MRAGDALHQALAWVGLANASSRVAVGTLVAFLQRMIQVSRARAELFMGRPRRTSMLLEDFGPEGPERPYWGSAWVFLTRGQALDAQQQRDLALTEYARVTELELPRGSRRATRLAEQGLEIPFDPAARSCGATYSRRSGSGQRSTAGPAGGWQNPAPA